MMCRAARAWLVALGVVSAVLPARGAAPVATLDGAWAGTLKVARVQQTGAASATLSETGGIVSGTLTLAASGMSGTATVIGTIREGQAHLTGVLGAQQVRWKGHWVRPRHAWRGTLVVHGGGHRMRGVLGFLRADGGPQVQCGADYFASDVMPHVFEPICSQCHVPGGLAERTRLRVTVGDPAATALSAFGLVDRTSPLQSLLLLKPRGAVAHGGGVRFAPGSVEDQTLQHWIEQVTTPGCGGGGTGGGSGGGGGGGPTGDPYVDNCASCHGTDARGVQGRPDIHCNRSVQDAVRNGRTGPAGIMPAFPTLSDADVATIQTFLLGLCPATTVTGSDLFASNCATCHGSDARGVGGRPSIRCNRAIHDVVRSGVAGPAGTMPAFSTMSDPDIALVQGYLVGLCPPGTASGDDLYAGNCATCHGSQAGGLGTAPSVRCATRVADAVQRGRAADMPIFPDLIAADITNLIAFLDGLCTLNGRTGADLYAGNCSSCHGLTAHGGLSGLGVQGPNIQCTGVGDYREKVRFGEDRMPAFPTLDTNDVDAIASFVHGAYCGGG